MPRRRAASPESRSAIRTPGGAWNQCAPSAVFCTMETHVLPSYSQRRAMPRWLIVGFIAGALAVIVFHQSALAVLHALQLSRSAPYSFFAYGAIGHPAAMVARLLGRRLGHSARRGARPA